MAATVAAVLAATPQALHAQTVDDYRVAALLETQDLLNQRAAVEALLIALDVDRDANLQRLARSRDQLGRAVAGLRQGDTDLTAFRDIDLLGLVEQAEQVWTTMDATLADCLAAPSACNSRVGPIAESSIAFQQAIVDLGEATRSISRNMDSYSMLEVAVQAVGGTRILSQQMSKEFLLIASGHQADRNRYGLQQDMETFGDRLVALQDGNFDLLLLPAPTPEIRAQLRRIDDIWQLEYRPLLDSAFGSGSVPRDALTGLAEVNLRLLQEIESAAAMYSRL